jgi:hypothetical protein
MIVVHFFLLCGFHRLHGQLLLYGDSQVCYETGFYHRMT